MSFSHFFSRSVAQWLVTATIIGSSIPLTACQPQTQQKTSDYGSIHGETMGTTYHITFQVPKGADKQAIQATIDKKLLAFNKELSTWETQSTITQFNQMPAGQSIAINQDFVNIYDTSRRVYQQSGGAFNPTVKPILELWGFGKEMRVDRLQNPPSDAESRQAKQLIDFDSIEVTTSSAESESESNNNSNDHPPSTISKRKDGVAIDFSAIAKGYGVDVIAEVLASDYHINNYMVEIGGEVATSGVNDKGLGWQIGIDAPILYSGVTDRQLIATIRQPLNEGQQGSMHLATSGNYRNSIIFEGIRYSHTIDPHTGKPIIGGAPSVTVADVTVALADAWATALTAMPYEQALKTAQDLDKAVLFVVLKDGVDANQQSHGIDDWQVVETEQMTAMRKGQ